MDNVIMSSRDLDIAARTVAGEARGEKNRVQAMKAVAHVIINRSIHGGWWGNSISEVCQKPKQFSCWNENDPNRELITGLTKDSDIYRDAVTAVALAAVDDDDPTNGATHYYATWIDPPWWAKDMEETAKFGLHRFLK
tara:strand:+ start:147 stop:560 length:414 start_codon:yes stop_codon:yes gene_type:complete